MGLKEELGLIAQKLDAIVSCIRDIESILSNSESIEDPIVCNEVRNMNRISSYIKQKVEFYS